MATYKKYVNLTGDKRYELSNHLGNVLVVINDKKIPEFEKPDMPETGLVAFNADVLSYSDYYPFGMLQEARQGSKANYRYGFQGQEMDNEIKGEGNSLNYTFRMHDPRVGRFFAVDPLFKEYPHYTPYSFSGNKVIAFVELEGKEEAKPNYLDDFATPTFATFMDIKHSFSNLVTNAILKANSPFLAKQQAGLYWGTYAKQLNDYGYVPSNPSSYVQWGFDIDPETGFYDIKNSRLYIMPKGTAKQEFLKFLGDVVTVGLMATSFKVGGMSGPMILAQRTGLGESALISTFKRVGKLGGEIKLTWGNAKKGMEHILRRHSADEYLNNPAGKGDLFPTGTSDAQIIQGIEEVYSKGKRISNPQSGVQTFEKRIKMNGESANYKLVIDKAEESVISFYKSTQ